MAVAPTGAIYKSLIFDGEDSRDYGVYITGEAVYNAPERDVEMIAIPGRNGAFALDKGRFENIEVSYPAGIFADNETDFAEAISDFRNVLCSRKGYVRLEDEYNPNEYRMAVYKSGLEVSPTQLMTGEFEIIFECKPQRWLTSGETKQTIATSGDTITNPTLFESGPLLEVEGYGTLTLNGRDITLINEELGTVGIHPGYTTTGTLPYQAWLTSLDVSRLNVGDSITISGVQVRNTITLKDSLYTITTFDLSEITNIASSSKSLTNNSSGYILFTPDDFVFQYGTASTSSTSSLKVHVYAQYAGNSIEFNKQFTCYFDYDGDHRVDIYFTGDTGALYTLQRVASIPQIYAYSTLSVLPIPVYIDLDIGEAYGEYSGVISPINNAVTLPAKLPTLAPGSNTITYDNTITSLKVTPRWWKV